MIPDYLYKNLYNKIKTHVERLFQFCLLIWLIQYKNMYMYFSCQMNNACVCQCTKAGYTYIPVRYEYEIFSPFAEDFVTHDLRLKLKIAQH